MQVQEQDWRNAIRTLQTEVAANRLILRALVAHLIVRSGSGALDMLTNVRRAIDEMAPDVAPLDDTDKAVHRAAADLVRERASRLLDSLAAHHSQPSHATSIHWPESRVGDYTER